MSSVNTKLNIFFTPDISITFDKDFKCYIFTPLTDLGKAWNKRYKGVVMNKGFLVANSNFNDCYDSILKCGLTVEIVNFQN